MNELQIFKNENFGNVRVIEKNGEPWFIAKDIALALGYSNTRKAIIDHCEGVTNRYSLKTEGGRQELNIISEKGLYRLIMRSKLESAIKFQDWVCDEVLPSIRKHGIYATDSFVDQALSDPDHMIRVLEKFRDERAKRIEAEKTVNILTHVNKNYTVTEIAKEAGFKSATALNKWLHEKNVQYKQNKTWIPYSKFSQLGYFDIKQEVLDNGHIIYHRRITQMGREFILKLIEKDGQK